jgi:predicted TIM-barrel fold metal-dependent hydrolase
MGVYVTEVAMWLVRPVTFMLWGGVFERFPKLKVAITEGTAVWVPEYLQLLEQRYSETHYSQKLGDYRSHLSMSSRADYFRRNVRVGASCMPRREALMRHEIGVGSIMWGTDYPHPEGSWPYTRKQMHETFHGLPEDEIGDAGRQRRRVLRRRRREAGAAGRAHRPGEGGLRLSV